MIPVRSELTVWDWGYRWNPPEEESVRWIGADGELEEQVGPEELERFCWLDWDKPGGQYLDELPPSRTYDAFVDEPALFIKLARLEPSKEAIVEFANKFGNLEEYTTYEDAPRLYLWQDTIGSLSLAIELWQATLDPDKHADVFRKHFHWKRGKIVFHSPLCARPFGGEDRENLYKPSDPVPPALDMIGYEIGQDARAKMAPRRISQEAMAIEMVVDRLRDALWVQLALAISGSKAYRDCETCLAPFELTPGVNRADRVFCSDSCRVSAYRKRKARALELHAAGRPLKAIIKEVGTDAEVVKRWLANGKD